MVVTEVALALVLSVGAGLLGSSFTRLWSVDRGFTTTDLVVLSVDPDPVEYPAVGDRERFVRELRVRFDAIPGVTATAANQVPLRGSFFTRTYYAERLEGEPVGTRVLLNVGLENYLDLMGIPLLDGRRFSEADAGGAPLVGIVNQAMAQALWPGSEAVGQRVRASDQAPWVEIIGVAGNVKHQGLTIDPQPTLYLPGTQSAASDMSYWVLRIRGGMGATIDLARSAVAAQSPTTPVGSVQILDETISASVAVPRLRMVFVVGLAAFAVGLALLGVYGVMTFAVAQRSKEIGIRMALGADARGVVRGVVGTGLKLSTVGVVAGMVIAWLVAGRLEAFLFGVAPTDVAIYLVAGLSVIAVSGLASYLPARRAATVDPVAVLKRG